MEALREAYSKNAKLEEEKQLAEIINKPNLSSQELWLLTERNFILWRKKYDYPKLLASFDEKLPRFQEWREMFGISHEELMEYTITRCIAPKQKKVKDKTKYIIQAKQDNVTQLFTDVTQPFWPTGNAWL